jgi:hypothetical protein
VALGLLAAALLSGCTTAVAGTASPDRTGPEVVADAAAALEQSGAFTVRGTTTDGGKAVTVDVHLQGEDSTGTMTVDGATVRFVRVAAVTYLQGTPQLWSSVGAPGEVATRLADTWLRVGDVDLGLSATPESLASQAAQLRLPGESPVMGTVRHTTLDGVPVSVVSQADGGELWVAETGPAYPLHADSWGPESQLSFSDFGVRQDIAAPAGAIDLSDIGG